VRYRTAVGTRLAARGPGWGRSSWERVGLEDGLYGIGTGTHPSFRLFFGFEEGGGLGEVGGAHPSFRLFFSSVVGRGWWQDVERKEVGQGGEGTGRKKWKKEVVNEGVVIKCKENTCAFRRRMNPTTVDQTTLG